LCRFQGEQRAQLAVEDYLHMPPEVYKGTATLAGEPENSAKFQSSRKKHFRRLMVSKFGHAKKDSRLGGPVQLRLASSSACSIVQVFAASKQLEAA